jgi:hypothetical protein
MSNRHLSNTKTPEPTGSDTFLSFTAFPQLNRKISEGDFSWDGPLKPTIWPLFDKGPKCRAQADQFLVKGGGYDPRLIREFSNGQRLAGAVG